MSPNPNFVIPKVIKGTLNALKAASKQESIKRFVLTSSSTAALIPKPNEQGVVIDQSKQFACE
jgi:nucleoside-diphosphate-sugar epimerase